MQFLNANTDLKRWFLLRLPFTYGIDGKGWEVVLIYNNRQDYADHGLCTYQEWWRRVKSDVRRNPLAHFIV